MKASFRNVFLLGTLGMGSMMIGMTSCCDDEKENGGGGGGNTPVVSVKVEFIKIGRKSGKDAPIENKLDTSFRFITLTTDGEENPSGKVEFYLDTIAVLPANATNKKLRWSSGKESLAKVDTSGGDVKLSVTSWVGGIANIYAEAIDGSGIKDTFKVIVNHRKKVECNRVYPNTSNKIPTYAVQLWDNGPWWAEFNVGATIASYSGLSALNTSNPDRTVAGNYFKWGATSEDVAYVNWGANWRMPTGQGSSALPANTGELYELVTKTTNHWCSGAVGSQFEESHIAGKYFKGTEDYAGDSIFFPAAGCYNSGDINDVGTGGHYHSSVPSGSNYAWSLYFDGGNAYMGSGNRNFELSVRAVCAK